MNKLTIIGNLVRDPELKFTQSGIEICSISIAYNEVYKQDGEKKEKVHFFNCEAWTGIAKTITEYFKKGDKIGITGKIKQERWEDQEGKARSVVKILIQEIDFLQGKREKNTENQPAAESPFSDNDIPF